MSKESVSPAGSSPAYLLLCLVSVNSGGVSQLCVPTQPGAIGHTIAGPGAGASARLGIVVSCIVIHGHHHSQCEARTNHTLLTIAESDIERKDI